MNDILFRFMDPETIEWVEAGELSVHTGSLADLAVVGSGRRCVLVVDSRSVVLAEAVVPARQRQTVLRAVPYALEEQFAEDVDRLHFAIGDRGPDGSVPVAAVLHEELNEWLQRCRSAGVAVAAVIPEALLVPWQEGAWTLLLDGERALIRQSRYLGFCAERALLEPVLARLWSELSDPSEADGTDGPELPELRVIAPVEDDWLEEYLQQAQGPVQQEQTDVPTLALLAAGYTVAAGMNLLQGPYSPKARIGRYLRPWRVAAALLLAVVATQFGANMVERHRLQSRSDALSVNIENIYRQAFPDAQRVVNARAQMESRLQALKQSAGGSANPFLQILAVSGPVLRSADGVKLTGLNYRDGTLSLGVSAGSLQSVDQLREQLRSGSGVQVEIQSASSRDGKVNSRLLIKEGAS